ncbi:hypothetical protein EDB87DRAFT_1656412 [Lactarius vividus]|nr:hypothetical protein EDB87DRAFT_1656412 [Lactarius vividus]
MHTQRPLLPIPVPGFQFRVLIVGRANAGKTTILQSVCDTTESPGLLFTGERRRHVVQAFVWSLVSLPTRLFLTRP